MCIGSARPDASGMLLKILRPLTALFGRNSFLGDSAILMAGTTFSQAIIIAFSPVLSRIYAPESFGMLGLFTSACSILGVAATGRYELAVIIPKEDRDGFALAVLSSLLSAGFSVLLLAGLLLFGVDSEYYLLPLAVFLSTAIGALGYWLTREGRFTRIAAFRVSASVGNIVVCVGLGLAFGSYALGLIFGLLASYAISLLFLLPGLPKFSPLPLGSVAQRYSRFPKFLVGAHLMSVGSQQLPLLLLGPIFGLHVAGLFVLTHRAISLPIQIVSSAIGDVFRRHASRDFRELGQCRETYISTLKLLVAISLPTFCLLFWLAPALFSLVFGPEWQEAGEIARLLTPMFAVQFVASPLSAMFIIAEQQKLDLFWQGGMLTAVLLALGIGSAFGSYMLAIGLYSLGYVIMQSVSMALTYKFANGGRF